MQVEFKCGTCGADVDLAPDPPEKPVCENCCPDHEYEYVREERRHACKRCGKEPPFDWFYD